MMTKIALMQLLRKFQKTNQFLQITGPYCIYNYSNRSYTEEQLQHSEHSKSTLDTSVNLNLKKKGINIGFLNIQGICGKEMVKFSEINLMLSSQENKKLHAFAMCETKLKDHKMSGAFKIKGFQTIKIAMRVFRTLVQLEHRT